MALISDLEGAWMPYYERRCCESKQCHRRSACILRFTSSNLGLKQQPGGMQHFQKLSEFFNPSVESMLLEWTMVRGRISYLKCNNLLPLLQSAYRYGLRTDTSVTKVLSDIVSCRLAKLCCADNTGPFRRFWHSQSQNPTSSTMDILCGQWFRGSNPTCSAERRTCVCGVGDPVPTQFLAVFRGGGLVLGQILFFS